MCLKETELEEVDWIHLAEDREERWAVVNTVMNMCLTQTHVISLPAENIYGFQEGLITM
jgi:hypothetical protein